jgi:hypothetical protein
MYSLDLARHAGSRLDVDAVVGAGERFTGKLE